MNNMLLLVGVSSGFAHSLYAAVSKSILKNRIAEPFLLLLYVNVFQAIVTPVVWLFARPALPPAAGLAPLLTAGATCLVAYFFLYMALSHGDVSSIMPIMGSKIVFAGLLAMAMLNEHHSWSVYLAAILVTVSVAMLSYSPSKTRSARFPLKPIGLMIVCCMVFGLTDIYIKRSLAFMDSYNFMVYYNLIVGVGSLSVIPYLRKKKISLVLKGGDLWLSLIASVCLVAATLLFVITFEITNGVVIPNILMSTRGVFVVVISAVLAHRGSAMLEMQNKKVYLLRFAASGLIMFSIWIALSN